MLTDNMLTIQNFYLITATQNENLTITNLKEQ